ncbi:MAG: toxin-activating lysine-acyltransferase [Alphaproteobacteria bacterium]|nr:toxin-activating lysine-acyltransferase [Alphaproteobacteria bacterium]
MAKKPTSKKAASPKPAGRASKPAAKQPKEAAENGATGPFTQPSPSPASRTVAGVLGEITWLMTQSPNHKGFFISDLEWMIMVPVMLQQFRLFYDKDKPIGVALYARVDDEVEERLKSGNARLRPQDWKSGTKLWIVEIIAPFGGHEAMLTDFKEQLFKDTDVHYLMRSAKGNEVRIV